MHNWGVCVCLKRWGITQSTVLCLFKFDRRQKELWKEPISNRVSSQKGKLWKEWETRVWWEQNWKWTEMKTELLLVTHPPKQGKISLICCLSLISDLSGWNVNEWGMCGRTYTFTLLYSLNILKNVYILKVRRNVVIKYIGIKWAKEEV